MSSISHITNLLSRLVMELALTTPIAYIKNIVFYSNGKAVADCNWEKPGEGASIILYQFQPAYITFHKNFDNFTDIEVSAIDADGNPLCIRPAMAGLLKQEI